MLVTEHVNWKLGTIEVPVHEPFMYGALKLTGEYCPGEAGTYARLIRPGFTVLDIGANIGIFTLIFAHCVGPEGRVLAFEPQKTIHDILTRNLEAGGGVAEAVRAVVSDRVGAREFIDLHTLSEDQTAWLGGASVNNQADGHHSRMVETRVLTIDSLELEACDLIKIDVEGHEAEVLAGARGSIEAHEPLLSIEANLPTRDYGYVDALRSRGYRFHLVSSLYVRETEGARPPIEMRGFVLSGKVSRMLIGIPPRRAADYPEAVFDRFRRIDGTDELTRYLAASTRAPDWDKDSSLR